MILKSQEAALASEKQTPEMPLPAYDDSAHTETEAPAYNDTPPDYALRSNFTIGKDVTPRPLVSTTQLQVHLDLLRAFKALKTRVEEDPSGLPENARLLTAEKRWVWFLELSVERYVYCNF